MNMSAMKDLVIILTYFFGSLVLLKMLIEWTKFILFLIRYSTSKKLREELKEDENSFYKPFGEPGVGSLY